jgi:hypothetical protein
MTLRNTQGTPLRLYWAAATTPLCEGSFDGVVTAASYSPVSRTITLTLEDGVHEIRDQHPDSWLDIMSQISAKPGWVIEESGEFRIGDKRFSTAVKPVPEPEKV